MNITPSTLSYFVSWSGGKDSCLALYRAKKRWGQPAYLLNMLTEDERRSRSHGLAKEVLLAQAELLSIPIQFYAASWNDYERIFAAAMNEAKQNGLSAGVFGDVRVPEDPDWQSHCQWAENICAQAGLIAYEPIWDETAENLLEEFFASGFCAQIVAVKASCLDAKYLGQVLTPQLIEEFRQQGIHPAGEKGEFHTIVIDGPLFSQCLHLKPKGHHLKSGCWFLDYQLA